LKPPSLPRPLTTVMMLRLQAAVLFVLLALQECTCSPGITLRVRLPNGGVKRVTAEEGDTLSSVLSKLEQPDARGLAKTAGGAQEPAESSLLELGVKHGDFLYAVQDADAAGAAVERRKAKAAQVRAAAAAKPAGEAWHPFSKLARPPKPSGTSRSWADIEAQTAQTYKLVPQKAGRVKKVSLDADGVSAFADRFYSAGCKHHRCGALFGTVDTAAGAITVQAVYDVPIGSGDSSSYDPTGLLNSSSSEADTISDIQRAQQVAAALGLRQVGWCFTHSQRTHHLAGRDVATAAAVQLQAMRSDSNSSNSSSKDSSSSSRSSSSKKEADAESEGAFCATVAVVVDPSDGSAVTEAYGISDLGVQMCSDGVLAAPLQQTDAAGDTVTTTETVLDENKPTQQPGTLNFIVNMPIVEHKGLLRSAFPAENDVTPAGSSTAMPTAVPTAAGARHRQTELALLRRHLFHKSAPGATSASRFLKRVSDFNLLVFLSRLLGHDEPLFLQLCACVREQDSENTAVEKCKAMLEAMCATHSPDEL
jgi:hypothetical protein